jgi:magnesium-protoporphyrin IX monomethyl ester (oxidative) cyclase
MPSLGVPLLKANLNVNGFATDVLYTNCRLAEHHGLLLQLFLSGPGDFLTDYMFAHVLFERSRSHLERYAELMRDHAPEIHGFLSLFFPSAEVSEVLAGFATIARDFGERIVREILERDPWLVGISSNMSDNAFALHVFQQVKRRRPEIITVMGGANCSGEMGEELFARFPEIDHICQGDADRSLVELVSTLAANGRVTEPIRGVLTRGHEGRPVEPAAPLTGFQLEALPDPDFTEAFEQIAPAQREYMEANRDVFGFPILTMETSRGCWWAAKRERCAFCGLNPNFIEYSTKSPRGAYEQLARLTERYNPTRVQLVDNLPASSLFKTFWPEVAAKPVVDMFSEALGSLTRPQVELLARARVVVIQSGIESLSDNSVKLMAKPTTPQRSIENLKWCAEFGVDAYWGYLYGIPGEKESEVGELKEIIDRISHLQPPTSLAPIVVTRDSRYFESPAEFGIEPLLVRPLIRELYPFPEESVKRISYFLDSAYFQRWRASEAWKEMEKLIAGWQRIHWRSHLLYVKRRRGALVIDTRPSRRRWIHRLTPLEARILEYCGNARTLNAVLSYLGPGEDERAVAAILDSFVENRIVLRHDQLYLSLTVEPQERYRWKCQEPDAVRALNNLPLRESWSFGRSLGLARTGLIRTLLMMSGLKAVTRIKNLRWWLVSGALSRAVAILKARLTLDAPASVPVTSKPGR